MRSRDKLRWRTGANIALAICSALALLPFILLIIASFTDYLVALESGYSYFPAKLSLDAYQYIFDEFSTIARTYGMSILVTVIGTALSLAITTMLAYMLAQRGLPGRKILNLLVVITILFNAGLVPTYIIYTKYLHIKNTIWAYIVPNLLMSGFMVMIVRIYFENSVPEDILDAARIDGASEMHIFLRIVLPLSKPILATVGLLTGISYWNDWQNGLYYINEPALLTVQSYLNKINENISFLASNAVSGVSLAELPTATVRMAIAVVAILPILILYPFFHKYFAKGLTMGSMKG